MESVAKLVDAVAWPLLALFLFLWFREPVGRVLESAVSRKVTVEVAGNKLTMEEVNEQQRSLIADLQEQVARIQQVVAAGSPAKRDEITVTAPKARAEARSILWVDDNPRNNSQLVAHLQDRHVEVVTVTSTKAALEALSQRHFDRIISDMGRREGLLTNRHAGLDFVRAVRSQDRDTPIIIFASSNAVEQYGEKARQAGATEVTASATSLLSALALG